MPPAKKNARRRSLENGKSVPSGAMDRDPAGDAIAAIERRPIDAAVPIAISWIAVPIAAIAVSRITVAIGRGRIAVAAVVRPKAVPNGTSSARVNRRPAVCPSVNPATDPGNARRS